MKKLYLLALILLVPLAIYSQVESLPNMVRYSVEELGFTTYDWQTNWGAINRTIVWPDGKVSFAFTYASDEEFSDRGTCIATYDCSHYDWNSLEGRVESEKTNFGSIARYEENGIIVVAQTETGCGIFIVEDKDNITPNSTACSLYLDPAKSPCCPVVMTSGYNRDIIHVLANGSDDNKLYYFRSSDGQTWDVQNVILPYLTEEYGSSFAKHTAYWMETTDDNCLAFVVNNPWSDGMVIYSYDNGETWERKVFYHHPGINTTYDNWFLYPRWTSCVWGNNGELCVAYEFNGSKGEPGSNNYDLAIGGVAFWSEGMPYHGEENPDYGYGFDPTNPIPPAPGQPFIMDSAYLFEDIFASSLYVENPTHELWPEYFGYLGELDYDCEFLPPDPPYFIAPENLGLHGDYNCGVSAMPVLCKVPETNYLVAVWIAMELLQLDYENNYYYFKIFSSISYNGGRTWSRQVHVSSDFMFFYSEFVYPQAVVVDHYLVIVCQADDLPGTFVQDNENDSNDNYYVSFVFDLFSPHGCEEVEHDTRFTVYPNPVDNQVNVMLTQYAEIKVYNVMGQIVMTMEGHVGVNRIDIGNLNSGIYFVNVGNDTQKFIVR